MLQLFIIHMNFRKKNQYNTSSSFNKEPMVNVHMTNNYRDCVNNVGFWNNLLQFFLIKYDNWSTNVNTVCGFPLPDKQPCNAKRNMEWVNISSFGECDRISLTDRPQNHWYWIDHDLTVESASVKHPRHPRHQ